MKQRLITAACLLAVLAVVVWQINTPVLLIAVAFLSAVASGEIMKCAKVENTFIRVVGIIFSACFQLFASAKVLEPWVSASTWSKVIDAVPNIVYIIILCLVFFLAMLKDYAYTTFEDVSVSIFASVAVPFGFSIFIRLRDMYVDEQFGIYLIFYALICALATDTGAQLMGMAFGKHKMAPKLSPKKSVEGGIGGIAGAALIAVLYALAINHWGNAGVSVASFAIIGAAGGAISQIGDLAASAIKRNHDIKDYGKLIPGHGGILDRFDSIIFTAPIIFYLSVLL